MTMDTLSKANYPNFTLKSTREYFKISLMTISTNWSYVFPMKLFKTNPSHSTQHGLSNFSSRLPTETSFSRLSTFISATSSPRKFSIPFTNSVLAPGTSCSLSRSALKRHPYNRWNPSYKVFLEPRRSKLFSFNLDAMLKKYILIFYFYYSLWHPYHTNCV